MIHIAYAINGWIIYFDEEDENGESIPEVFGFPDECGDDSLERLDAMRLLLYKVAEEMGVVYSKHNRFNLAISVEDMQKRYEKELI
jgi:hypothetical protein